MDPAEIGLLRYVFIKGRVVEVFKKKSANPPSCEFSTKLLRYCAISYSKWQLDTCALTHTAQTEPLVLHRIQYKDRQWRGEKNQNQLPMAELPFLIFLFHFN